MDSMDVRQMRQVAFVMSQVACMLAELEGLKAANGIALLRLENPPYDDAAFVALPERFGLYHNQVIAALNSGV